MKDFEYFLCHSILYSLLIFQLYYRAHSCCSLTTPRFISSAVGVGAAIDSLKAIKRAIRNISRGQEHSLEEIHHIPCLPPQLWVNEGDIHMCTLFTSPLHHQQLTSTFQAAAWVLCHNISMVTSAHIQGSLQNSAQQVKVADFSTWDSSEHVLWLGTKTIACSLVWRRAWLPKWLVGSDECPQQETQKDPSLLFSALELTVKSVLPECRVGKGGAVCGKGISATYGCSWERLIDREGVLINILCGF